ncbi:hypothetical protein [Brevundimonas naejangsanensis]|uniref:hypothetical protein n=1 Tax=Brevundimonas naejangsanensis TaxID=588932 RepID=UPI0026EAB1DB|nr:hypothetical protein [Brevundimonas naejangsanensis]
MASRPRVFRATAQPTRQQQNREADRRRGSARQRGYTTAWDKASAGHVRNNPLCRYCDLAGQVRPAELTDHLYPHRGDQDVFWNKRYWIASCAECHSGFKQRVERRGRAAIDALAIRLGLDPL